MAEGVADFARVLIIHSEAVARIRAAAFFDSMEFGSKLPRHG